MLTAVAFLIAYLTGCLLAIIRHPVYGLMTYIALVYTHPPSAWWGQALPAWRWSLIAAVVTLFAVWISKAPRNVPRLSQFGVMWGLLFFVIWIIVQKLWALDGKMHSELVVIFLKYLVLVGLVYKCIDTVTHLKLVLWTHAAGCFYLGTVVLNEYLGGRFEGFRGPGINESNAAALLIVTGVLTTFALFLSGRPKEKIVAVGFMPLILNALVATISRSGFLALAVSGVIFNLFAPKRLSTAVRIFSVAGLVLLVLITNPVYWERIGTIVVAGQEIEGVDTGSRRLLLIQKQFEMFSEYPLGCGHRCTAVLSPAYLDDRYLTGSEGNRARSSHSTFTTLLVEQGVPGVVFYIFLLIWVARTTFRLRGKMRSTGGVIPVFYAAVVSILGAITVGDMFVDYLKFEARFWFIGLLMVVVKMDVNEESVGSEDAEKTISEPTRTR